MLPKTRDTLLYGQLQDGLPGPHASSCRIWSKGLPGTLCRFQERGKASRGFEKERMEYAQANRQSGPQEQHKQKQILGEHRPHQKNSLPDRQSVCSSSGNAPKMTNTCFYCRKPGHLMRDYRQRKRVRKERIREPKTELLCVNQADLC